jgi:tellurite methyltransferase
MADAQKAKWEQRYGGGDGGEPPPPARVLVENAHLLPAEGAALDLACGLAGNAFFLVEQGLDVWAWDYSSAAIERVRVQAVARGLRLHAEVRDAVAEPPESARFDVIVVTRFLERALVPALIDALRPAGLLYYQTFTRARVDDTGPANPAYRLAPNELLALFRPLQILVYREEDTVGDVRRGFRNEAMLVARKGVLSSEF